MRNVALFCCTLLLTVCGMAKEIPLNGCWEVRLKDGTSAEITLPGTLGEAGIGEETTVSRPGTLTPRRQFVGKASYVKTITLPAELEGDYELFLERVMWKSEAAWDGKPLGSRESLATPHVYKVPAAWLTPGKHTLTLTIDNTELHPVGANTHAYSKLDVMQRRWNGVLGAFCLRPTNPLRATRVFAPFGDTVTILLPEKMSAEASIDGVKTETIATEPGKIVLRVPEAKAWSPRKPNLYTLLLKSGPWEHRIRFGFRTLERRGNGLWLNGKPFFLRGNLDCCQFPLTGAPATDIAAWRRILSTLKGEGVNQIRFHSWCPPQAAFDAADELGMLVGPEACIWVDGPKNHPTGLGQKDEGLSTFVQGEMRRICDTYGNSPAFSTLLVGNELGSANYPKVEGWINELRSYDPRRLYSLSTAWRSSAADDYFVSIHIRGHYQDGTDWDYEPRYAAQPLPTIAHEIGQWPVYPDYADLGKHVGLMRPLNHELMREAAARAGVLRFNKIYARTSLMTCLNMYKMDMEGFLRTPSCAGYQLLSVQDFTGQGEALVGWFDAFYDRKSGAEDAVPVSAYNTDVAPLARFAKSVWTTDETFTAKLLIRNDQQLAVPPMKWAFADKQGSVTLPKTSDRVAQVAEIAVPLANVKAPAKLELRFGNNRWPIWVYPAKETTEYPKGVTVTKDWPTARAALREGKRVLLHAARPGERSLSVPASFRPLFWSGTWFASQRPKTLGTSIDATHPAFAEFPTEDWADWQWRRILENAAFFKLEGRSATFRPLVMPVCDYHTPALLGVLFELRMGEGRLMICGTDLDAAFPEVRQLRRSVLNYMASENFRPAEEASERWLDGLLLSPRERPFRKPAAFSDALAYIECGAFLEEAGKDIPFAPTNDRALLPKGMGYTLSGEGVRTWADRTGGYWVGDHLKVTMDNVPKETCAIWVRFRDPNITFRSAKGSLEGRPFEVPVHIREPNAAWWAKLPVPSEDLADGRLVLDVAKSGGHNVMIDRIILLPQRAK